MWCTCIYVQYYYTVLQGPEITTFHTDTESVPLGPGPWWWEVVQNQVSTMEWAEVLLKQNQHNLF